MRRRRANLEVLTARSFFEARDLVELNGIEPSASAMPFLNLRRKIFDFAVLEAQTGENAYGSRYREMRDRSRTRDAQSASFHWLLTERRRCFGKRAGCSCSRWRRYRAPRPG